MVRDPSDVATVLRPLGIWWAIAGGWAIDLWIDTQTRDHHDVEIVVQRSDEHLVHKLLRDNWELSCIDPPGSGWRQWRADDHIALPSFQAKASNPVTEFDIFLESVNDDTWTFRRDARIHRPLADVVSISRSGIPAVSPDIQLLYMAKSVQPKNQHDFDVVLPTLPDESVVLLDSMLAVAYPHHHWRDRLA
jgi:hypothetical protein